jgi:hypothetical protein
MAEQAKDSAQQQHIADLQQQLEVKDQQIADLKQQLAAKSQQLDDERNRQIQALQLKSAQDYPTSHPSSRSAQTSKPTQSERDDEKVKVDTFDDTQENERDVLAWTAGKVGDELLKLSTNFAKHRPKFIENNVNGALLQSIVDDTGDEILRSVGMAAAQV